MKLLETEFVQNSDNRGDHKFVQVKRNEFAAMYRRYNMEGKALEFEVFAIKVAGGTEIFGRYYDKYEQYPGASAWGKTAFTALTEEHAERIYQEITTGKGSQKDGRAIEKPRVVKVKVKGGKKGRPSAKRPAVVLPKKQFCMKDLVAVNQNGWGQPTLYIEVKRLLKAKQIVETARKPMGRGRPVVFYKVKAWH